MEAALAVAEEEGLAAVSMRRVARRLGAGTMSLYHYVSTKDDLLALMDDAIMADVVIPEGEMPEGWRARLTAIAHRSLDAWLRRPWLLTEDDAPRIGRNGMRHMDQSLAALDGLDIDPLLRQEILLQVDDYVIGFALRERLTGILDPDASVEIEPIARFVTDELKSGEYPHISAQFPSADPFKEWIALIRRLNAPGRFDRGLDRLLDGIEITLRAEGALGD